MSDALKLDAPTREAVAKALLAFRRFWVESAETALDAAHDFITAAEGAITAIAVQTAADEEKARAAANESGRRHGVPTHIGPKKPPPAEG